jgi:hypothetical protein
MEPTKNEKLLQLIPNERLSTEQKSFRPIEESFPVYELLREPTHLGDLNLKNECNATILSIGVVASPQYEERYLRFMLKDSSAVMELYCTIYGKSDAAIAETAA